MTRRNRVRDVDPKFTPALDRDLAMMESHSMTKLDTWMPEVLFSVHCKNGSRLLVISVVIIVSWYLVKTFLYAKDV